MTTTKKQTKEIERVDRLNKARAALLGTEFGIMFIEHKKQLAMDLYIFYLNLEKAGCLDDDAPPATQLPRLQKRTPQ